MKHFFILLLFFGIGCHLTAQKVEIPQESKVNRWRFGGGLGLSFGNHSSGVRIAPSVGYMITNDLEAGATLGYTYNKYRDYKYNVFSGGLFANYHIIPSLFTRAHYEYYTGKQKFQGISNSFNEDALWLGAGYQSTGAVSFQAGIMYNVLYDSDSSIYSSAWQPFAGVSISF